MNGKLMEGVGAVKCYEREIQRIFPLLGLNGFLTAESLSRVDVAFVSQLTDAIVSMHRARLACGSAGTVQLAALLPELIEFEVWLTGKERKLNSLASTPVQH